MVSKQPLLVLAGPTASGKTDLAVRLAKRLDGEVVSADSMQVYQELRIGTARPLLDELEGVPHHLLGFVPLEQAYSVAQYAEDARGVIASVGKRGKLPILCGGTGLYIQAVTDNLRFSEETGDRALRELLRARAAREGGEPLLADLRGIDPDTAARLHENDIGRIVRALELYYTTGLTITEQNRRSRQEESPYRTCMLLLDFHDRQKLYDRINQRVDRMLEQGLLEEASRVLRGTNASTALQAIGYKELKPYFEGECPLEAAVDNLKRETRRYAKRQLSWFRRLPMHRLYVDEDAPEELAAKAVALAERDFSI